MLAEFENLKEVDPADLKQLDLLIRRKNQEESRLTKMDLTARIRELGSEKITVTSAISGKVLDLADGEIQLRRLSTLIFRAFMDMQLVPNGVDIVRQ